MLLVRIHLPHCISDMSDRQLQRSVLVDPADTSEAAAGRDTDYTVVAPCRSQ